MKSFYTIALLLVTINLQAQEYVITGNVADEQGAAVDLAYVSLLSSIDSSRLENTQTNESGDFVLNVAKSGKYIVDVQMLGYRKFQKLATVIDKKTELKFTLKKTEQNLGEIVFTERKDRVVSEAGKLVVNVSEEMKAGSSVLDLLRNIPGLVVQPDGNIILNGDQGVVVLIDNKPTHLTGRALQEYLQSLTAAKVDKVELMDQPSSKYDAEGNAGIVNIKLNKKNNQGWSGNINTRALQGVYPFASGNANLFYTKGNVKVNVNPSCYYGQSFLEQKNTRSSVVDGIEQVRIEEDIFKKETFSDNAIKLGVDYDISDKTSLGVSTMYAYHPNEEGDRTDAIVEDVISSNKIYNNSTNENGFIRNNYRVNLYAQHEIDSTQNLQVNADYFKNERDIFQRLRTENTDQNGNNIENALQLNNDIPVRFDLVSAKVDYEKELSKNTQIEAGVKSSLVVIDEQNKFDIFENGAWHKDTSRSNHFKYKENINAGYVSVSTKVGKLNAKGGVRVEHTYSDGEQVTQNSNFKRNYVSVFPTAYVNYKANDDYTVSCDYNRRLRRPFYRELNPFILFASQYNYKTGNPQLQPQYSNKVTLKCNYKGQLVVSTSYTSNSNVFMDDVVFDNTTKVSNYSTTNNGKYRECAVSAYFNKRVVNWLNITANGSMRYYEYSGSRSGAERYAAGRLFNLGIDTQFNFEKGWYVQISGRYNSGYRSSLYQTVGGFVFVNSEVSKSLFNDTASIKLSISDPFRWYAQNTNFAVDNVLSSSQTLYNTQNMGLAFSYNFGRKAERRNSELEEAARM